jgi:hypothetical protein
MKGVGEGEIIVGSGTTGTTEAEMIVEGGRGDGRTVEEAEMIVEGGSMGGGGSQRSLPSHLINNELVSVGLDLR